MFIGYLYNIVRLHQHTVICAWLYVVIYGYTCLIVVMVHQAIFMHGKNGNGS